MNVITPQDILSFWFNEESRALWFASTPEFDRILARLFEATWIAGRDGKLSDWEESGAGALAQVILLDQFPLNMYRNRAESFSTSSNARAVASRAIDRGFDSNYYNEQQMFLYMPFMHSEDLRDQERSVLLFADIEGEREWALHHREIIRRFGRFPHRNRILGRESTSEELAWLATPEAFKG